MRSRSIGVSDPVFLNQRMRNVSATSSQTIEFSFVAKYRYPSDTRASDSKTHIA